MNIITLIDTLPVASFIGGLQENSDLNATISLEVLDEEELKTYVSTAHKLRSRLRQPRMAALLSAEFGQPFASIDVKSPYTQDSKYLLATYQGPKLEPDEDGNWPMELPTGGKIVYMKMVVKYD